MMCLLLRGKVVIAAIVATFPLLVFLAVRAADTDYHYLVGRGKADVTGPPVGEQMWGFVRADEITEGIHFRLFSRAFVVVDRETGTRIAFVSVDIGSITHAMHREVVDGLRELYGDAYTLENVIISATHTHGGPGGYWHYGADSPIGSAFFKEHFDAIADGITASIAQAHEDLQPGSIYINTGRVEGAGANRSAVAYLNNPESERARYDGDTDRGMTLLKLVDASGDIGMVNWFASHPTAMTYYNRLISGDHKGRASAQFEDLNGAGFVAAFAQSNAGDITPNLNLDNTGPGVDRFDSTRIIAARQCDVAIDLFATASERLSGAIGYRQTFVNMAYLPVAAEFTGAGEQTTCPSAYGYAFAAGSTEDGGGNPLFQEGMKTRNSMIDGVVARQFKLPEPSDRCRECQGDKAVLFAPGELNPPGQSQILPMTLARIGQLTLVCVPAEFTTMAGRRLRETVAKALGASSDYVVLVGYANDYGGYVTTREEYATQQYEGGHTLYGPWTLAAYRQEFSRLAAALSAGTEVERGPMPIDMRGQVGSAVLEAPVDALPPKTAFGEVAAKVRRSYKAGETVEVAFWSGNPRNDFRTGNNYAAVEREVDGEWITIATDNAWSTTCRWVQDEADPARSRFVVTWDAPTDAPPGNYRITHWGNYKRADGQVLQFSGASRTFRVK